MLLAELQDLIVHVEAVQEHADSRARELRLQAREQPVQRLELAVLLRGVRIGVLDEFGPHGEGQPVRRHQLRLEHGVIVRHPAILVLLRQARGAVPVAEGQDPGAVDGYEIVAPDPSLIQYAVSH